MSTTINQALAFVLDLVDAGTEFPDAVAKAAYRFRLSSKETQRLEQLYDDLDGS